ncbi:MAG: lysophospholipid acyltransferase family protein [Patescibacteria group bacterium]|jgi:1-acyl-sn-glycerol-3-phosphate acyltransferase
MKTTVKAGKLLYDLFGVLRSLIALLFFVLTVFICANFYMFWLLFLPRELLWRFWIRPCGWFCLKTLGQRVVIKGIIPDRAAGPYLYLINHQSFLDAFLVAYAMPQRITGVGAAKYFRLPVWGWMMKAHGIIPVDNKDRGQAIASMKKIEKAIKAGESLAVFPEGERSKTGHPQEFKKGAFHLAKNAQPVIIPCVIRGAYESWKRGSLLVRPGIITFEFLKPVTPAEYENLDFNELRRKLKKIIEQVFEDGENKTATDQGGI